jgi:hypothetical protein
VRAGEKIMSLYSLGLNQHELALLSHCCAEHAKTKILSVINESDLGVDDIEALFTSEEVKLNDLTVNLNRTKAKSSAAFIMRKVLEDKPISSNAVAEIDDLMKMGRFYIGVKSGNDKELPKSMGLININHGSTGATSLVDETGYISRFSQINFHTAKVFKYDLNSSKKTDYSRLMTEQSIMKIHLSPKQFAKVARANGAYVPVTLSRYLGEILPEPDTSIEFSEQVIRKDGSGVDPALEKALDDAMNDVILYLTPERAITSKKASKELSELLVIVGDAYVALSSAMQEQRKEDMKTLFSGYMQKFKKRVEMSMEALPEDVKSKIEVPTFSLQLEHK